jgi:hypothetical protein
MNASSVGGIATYYLYASYQEQLGKMFGGFIEFSWLPSKHLLRILQRPIYSGEILLLRCQNYRPESVIINDLYAGQWVKDYSLANCKLMLGEARSKFGAIAGPQGSGQLNGTALLQAGQAEIEKLDKDLETYVAGFGGTGYTFVIG